MAHRVAIRPSAPAAEISEEKKHRYIFIKSDPSASATHETVKAMIDDFNAAHTGGDTIEILEDTRSPVGSFMRTRTVYVEGDPASVKALTLPPGWIIQPQTIYKALKSDAVGSPTP